MAADSKQNIKTLRVDNWAVFFLQRLQLMFAKGDGCDLTLKFHTGQELKVHRLVLITCTTFFENMQKDGDVISMPEELPYSAVQPIINFLYSGKLEFKSELHTQLLNISKNLNIGILAKLLVTQKNDNGLGALPALKTEGGKKLPQRTFLATRIGPSGGGLGGRKLPIWRQRAFPLFRPDRNRVVKDEEPRPMRFEWPEGKEPTDSLLLTSPSFTPLSYKSEPVFTPVNPPLLSGSQFEESPPPLPQSSLKRRATPTTVIPDKLFKEEKRDRLPQADIKTEAPGDQGDFSDDDDGHFETIHNYDDSDDDRDQEGPKPPQDMNPPAVHPPPIMSQTSVQSFVSPARLRPAISQPTTPVQQGIGDHFVPMAESTPAVLPPPLVITSTPKPILKPNTEPPIAQSPAKKVRFSLGEDEEKLISKQLESQAEVLKQTAKELDTLSEITYESQAAEELPPTSSVTQSQVPPSTSAQNVVLPTLKESTSSASDVVSAQGSTIATPTSSVQAQQTTPSNTNKSVTMQTYSKNATRKIEKKVISPAESANHAKIIAEVLKKYPDLVKNNKNIRLKISAPGNTSITNTLTLDTKNSAGKAYVVVKSSVKTEKETPATFKGVTPPSSSKSLVSPASFQSTQSQVSSSGTGPWSCSPCGKDGAPLKFDSYYEFRRHFVEVHNEKFDSRTCEHCGYKTSKRNLYLYHLFTKHNVAPPKNINFPKCEQCGYIALSEGLLHKHAATHKSVKDWPCNRCEVVFKSYSSLQLHSTTCKGIESDVRISTTCPYCSATFRTSAVLSSHLKLCPANTSVIQRNDVTPGNPVSNIYEDTGPRPEQAVEMIEVPIMDADTLGGKGEHTYVQLPSGLILTDNPNVHLLPAGDGEELTAVGNNMGAPIGITMALPQDQHVILLDANSEFFIQGNDSVVVGRMNPNTEEYIVPEVLEDGMQQIYSTQGLPYSVTTSAGNMIACPVVPIQSSAQLDKHENSGSTVVRVQDHVDPSELDSMHIQHHVNVNASDIEYSNDMVQQSHPSNHQVDIYVEEQQPPPQRHDMTINKELMEVVAMEVRRTPIDHSSVVMTLPEPIQPQHSVLPSNQYHRSVSSSQAMPENRGELTELSVVSTQDHHSQDQHHLQDQHHSQDTEPGIGRDRVDESDSRLSEDRPEVPDGESIEIDDSGEGDEKIIQQAAKADSLVKDWGFDNEEESDAAVVIDDDSDSDEDGARMGPSRVTVEL
uniref:Centrosome-associated zinc finger protein CP190 n=1 Tax=Lygus hesperus TaxID=30085 RepID=A0A146M114_LYGHE